MGDRANAYIKDADVYLYGHWIGYDLAIKVRDALKRAPDRWTDSQYLARVVFCEMVRDDIEGTTGYGISHAIGDNERPVIVVDPASQHVSCTLGRRDADVTKVGAMIPFSEFVRWDDARVRAWHLGKEE